MKGSERFFPQNTPFKFVCECFFITQRALHIGVIPAINTFTKILSDLGKELGAETSRNEKLLKELNAVSSPKTSLYWSCTCEHLSLSL